MRQLYIWDKEAQKMVPVEEYTPRTTTRQMGIIEDTMAPTWHPADGKYYDSKSEFRRVTKAHGCEEYGNDITAERKPFQFSRRDKEKRIEAIKAAIEKTGYR